MESEVPAKQVIDLSRRGFLARVSAGGMALGAAGSTMKSSLLHADDAPVDASGKVIAGFETNEPAAKSDGLWNPFLTEKYVWYCRIRSLQVRCNSASRITRMLK